MYLSDSGTNSTVCLCQTVEQIVQCVLSLCLLAQLFIILLVLTSLFHMSLSGQFYSFLSKLIVDILKIVRPRQVFEVKHARQVSGITGGKTHRQSHGLKAVPVALTYMGVLATGSAHAKSPS